MFVPVCVCTQQEEVQQKAKQLERTMSRLESSLQEGCALLEDKNMKIELQGRREKELIASVHRYIIT